MTAAPALAAELSHESTVARTLVHVRALSEIFISDSARDGEDCFVAGVSCRAPTAPGATAAGHTTTR